MEISKLKNTELDANWSYKGLHLHPDPMRIGISSLILRTNSLDMRIFNFVKKLFRKTEAKTVKLDAYWAETSFYRFLFDFLLDEKLFFP